MPFFNPACTDCLRRLTARGKAARVGRADLIQCDSQEILTFATQRGINSGLAMCRAALVSCALTAAETAAPGYHRKLQEATGSLGALGGGGAHGSTCSSPRTERDMFSHQHPNILPKALDLGLLAADRGTKTPKGFGKLPS